MKALNPLELPLSGRQIIEASAGTGKTWTLAALYLRLVMGHGRLGFTGLSTRQILVMTFTDAATAELRKRIRDRLHAAAEWFDCLIAGQAVSTDSFLSALSLDIDPAQWPVCARRLHLAAQSMDEAAIYTIHGWSRRMLGSFALLSRDLFEQNHLDNPNELLQQLVRDHWRQWFYPLPPSLQPILLSHLGNDPDKLLQQLLPLWKQWDLQPPADDLQPAGVAPQTNQHQLSPMDILIVFQAWQSTFELLQAQVRKHWSADMAQVLNDARDAGLIRATGITTPNFRKWVADLDAWATQDHEISDTTMARFTQEKLQSCGWAQAAQWPVFKHIGELVAFASRKPDCKAELTEHAARSVRKTYLQAKQSQSVFDFNDLLQRLHQALHSDNGELAAAIRLQYPVAMVDEFQDTDPWQYQSLDRIYRADQVNTDNALVMIGDPKQAIYSFRGADLQTYLLARDNALARDPQACHTLDTNFRSAPGLVRAVNRLFSSIPQPFQSGDNQIDFVQVKSAAEARALCDAKGQPLPPLTFWHLPLPADAGEKAPWPAEQHVQTMSAGFAEQMVCLLQKHSDMHPGQMAVLVRSHAHAQAMQAALASVGLPSVFLSDHANVYQSPEATDLWRVLRAISMPRHSRWLRSAMASSLWGWTSEEMAQALSDPDHSDALAESCQQWLQQWYQQGVLPMLYQWMHSQGVAQRLLSQTGGERRMTNLLHLGELLQTAAGGLQGPQALLHFLVQQIQAGSDNPEEQKMRLETDAHCVQVVTYHKSKGLEYPFVFVPFLGSFKAASQSRDDDDDDSSESQADEDMRLLYVALTRAKRGMWLGIASAAGCLSGKDSKLQRSAVSALLQRQNHQDLADRLHQLFGDDPDIAIEPLPPVNGILPYQPVADAMLPQAALVAQRQDYPRWWTASFSSLTRGLQAGSQREEAQTDARIDAMQAPVETPPAEHAARWQSFPKGARYGSLLHDVLEWQAQQGWPLAPVHSQSDSFKQQAWQMFLHRKCRGLNLPQPAQDMLPDWVHAIVSTPLPVAQAGQPAPPLVLCHLTPECQWPEMEFQITVSTLASETIDRRVQQHVLPGLKRPALQARALQGMLTGFMDLVCEHAGRYWVLDYKSNWLDSYDTDSLNAAIVDKRYEVQYVLYLLALHRLLKSRLQGYDYDTHIGGAVYVFVRGIDSATAGVHCLKPPWTLIDQLDRAFAGAAL